MKRENLDLLLKGGFIAAFTGLFIWKGENCINYLQTQFNKKAPIEWVYKLCSSEKSVLKSDFERKVLPSGDTLHVVYGQHFSQDAAEHIYNNVAPEIEKNPSDWLFLVEGVDFNETFTFGPENKFAKALSDRYSIPTDDVIAGDYEKKVIDIVKEQGFSEDEIFINMMYTRYAIARGITKRSKSESRNYAVREVSELTGKEKGYLGGLIDEHMRNFYKADIRREEQLHKAILDARNQVSKENFKGVLDSPDTPNNILLVIGGSHYDITEF